MSRRLAAGLVLVGLGTVILVQFERPASIAMWVILVMTTMVVAGWRWWPQHPGSVPSLIPAPPLLRRRQPIQLAALELEVAAAIDPLLGGERPLRRRLIRLTEQRAGLSSGSLGRAAATDLLGAEASSLLFEPSASLTEEELGKIVERIERI